MKSRKADDLIRVRGGSFHIIKALVGFRTAIEHQIEKFPFEQNVFLMMRFRSKNKALSDFIIKTLSEGGFRGVRADHPDWNLTNNVYNPIAVLYCCKYGIALFDEAETNQAYNPNVIYELGMMHCLDRECLILRNDSLPGVPFDLIKDLYMPYKGKMAVQTNIRRWLQRIASESTTFQAPARTTGKDKLQYAAISAKEGEMDKVVSSPNDIATAEFGWQVSSKEKRTWKVSWNIKLTNNGQKASRVKIQVLFLDENGFALDDHTGPPTRAILSGETYLYRATAPISPDLAGRIRHALATVITTPS